MTAMTKTQRIAAERLSYHLWRADVEAAFDEAFIREQVPEAWHTLEADVDVEEPKVKVTLYLDSSVAKVFRAMGAGYQGRINRVLAMWVHMRAAGLLDVEGRLWERFKGMG